MNYSMTIDLERFVRKYSFRHALDLSETNFCNWHVRDERMELVHVPFLDTELVDLDSLVLTPRLWKKYRTKIYRNDDDKIRLVYIKKLLEENFGKPVKGKMKEMKLK